MDVGGFRQLIAVGAIMGVEEEYAVAPNATQNSVIPLSRPPHTLLVCTRFPRTQGPRTLTTTDYLSALFGTLNPIQSITRLEWKPSGRENPVHTSRATSANPFFWQPTSLFTQHHHARNNNVLFLSLTHSMQDFSISSFLKTQQANTSSFC